MSYGRKGAVSDQYHHDWRGYHQVRFPGSRCAPEPAPWGGGALPHRYSAGRQQEVDDLPQAVDHMIQAAPDTLDRDGRLVHPPGPCARPQMSPDPVFRLGGIGLHPTEQGCVIDRDAAVSGRERQRLRHPLTGRPPAPSRQAWRSSTRPCRPSHTGRTFQKVAKPSFRPVILSFR